MSCQLKEAQGSDHTSLSPPCWLSQCCLCGLEGGTIISLSSPCPVILSSCRADPPCAELHTPDQTHPASLAQELLDTGAALKCSC